MKLIKHKNGNEVYISGVMEHAYNLDVTEVDNAFNSLHEKLDTIAIFGINGTFMFSHDDIENETSVTQ